MTPLRMIDILRQLLGYLEDGSNRAVIIYQDSSTKEYVIKWDTGHQWRGKTLELALQNAVNKGIAK